MLNAETFVAFGLILFVGLLAYLGVHKTLNAALDKRADRIKAELAEAGWTQGGCPLCLIL